MKREMLINCLQSEEIRIAILEDGVLDELYVERASHESYVGNIYKGRIVNIEPSIQAAFVDFGVGRNGFLHVSDVEPAYYRDIEMQQDRRGGRGRDDRGRDDRGGRGGDRGGRGRGDRGARGRGGDRGERGGRPPQRQYPDYDEPRRDYPPTSLEPSVEGDAPPPAPVHYNPPEIDGPDIIVEEIHEEDDFYSAPSETALEMREPTTTEEAAPPPVQAWTEEPAALPPSEDRPAEPRETADPPPVDGPAPRCPRRMPRNPIQTPTRANRRRPRLHDQPRGKAPARGKKPPRKRTTKDEPESSSPPEPISEAAPTDEPKPRPMDSSECRTNEHDPSREPVSPRPEDLTDDDLSFSRAPIAPRSEPKPEQKPEYRPPQEPVEDIIVEEEEFVEPDMPDEHEEISSEPMEPAIAKIDVDESFEDLVEEEKDMEAEDDHEDEPLITEIGGEEEGPAFAQEDDESSEYDEYAARDPDGGGAPRGDRGRGGHGDRGGQGDRGPRGRGRGGDRRGGRDQGRDAGRRPGGRPGMLRPKPHIEEIFKRGQEVLVQVIKEGNGTKGPTLSTYNSIAGRYLVLMPGLNRIGVSRKIEDDETRRRLREIMNELRPPRGLGFIIRTAGQDRNREELQSDLAYLSRLWQVVAGRIKKQKSPCEIYKESDMVTRTIRDIFTADITTIWVDERGAYDAAKEFMEAVMPRYADRIKFYDGAVPMFHKYGIEAEIGRIQERKVSLPQGGSIVIDQAEALVAIDVNSGNFRANNNNAEETAFQMNLHAAKEIARQLRLRDLGGVIVNDFIDMREERHRRGVENALRDAVRRDRARTKILRISQFGIIEMTRQRIRPSLKRSAFQVCSHCRGTGHIKTCESVSIEVMRMLQLAVHRANIQRIDIRVHDDVCQYLLNRKRKEIVALEEQGGKQVSITSAGAAVSPEFLEFVCYDNNNNEVKFAQADEPPPRRSAAAIDCWAATRRKRRKRNGLISFASLCFWGQWKDNCHAAIPSSCRSAAGRGGRFLGRRPVD